MKIFSIDQSFSSSGIIIFDFNSEEVKKIYLIKTITRNRETKEKYLMEERIRFIVNEVSEILNKENCDYVFLEGLSFNNRNSISSRDLAGLYYALLILFLNKGIPYKNIPPKKVKAFALKGSSSKEEMFEKIPEHIKEKFYEKKVKKTTGLFDLADAYFIGKCGIFDLKKEISKNF